MLKILAPAKVNIGLWVKGKRKDGYHEILTLFHTIDLCDEIILKEGPLRVETSTGIPQEKNLVYKAILEFWKATGLEPSFSIYIHKRIPSGAGLGGGSSDAATVLKTINRIMGEPMAEGELKSLLAEVSADAPFFMLGGTALGKGKGEILYKLEHPCLSITLIVPEVFSSTATVYSLLKESDFWSPDENEIIEAIRKRDFSLFENTLGRKAMEIYPQIGEVYRFLEHCGYKPLVSGSGSAVFYIGEADPKVVSGARARGWKVFKVKSWLGV